MLTFSRVIFIVMVVVVMAVNLEAASTKNLASKGKYSPDQDKWAYKPDNRGKYVHVHIPYDGGYGPFNDPYDHDGRPYAHDDHPFKNTYFDDQKPAVPLTYGAPNFG